MKKEILKKDLERSLLNLKRYLLVLVKNAKEEEKELSKSAKILRLVPEVQR